MGCVSRELVSDQTRIGAEGGGGGMGNSEHGQDALDLTSIFQRTLVVSLYDNQKQRVYLCISSLPSPGFLNKNYTSKTLYYRKTGKHKLAKHKFTYHFFI